MGLLKFILPQILITFRTRAVLVSLAHKRIKQIELITNKKYKDLIKFWTSYSNLKGTFPTIQLKELKFSKQKLLTSFKEINPPLWLQFLCLPSDEFVLVFIFTTFFILTYIQVPSIINSFILDYIAEIRKNFNVVETQKINNNNLVVLLDHIQVTDILIFMSINTELQRITVPVIDQNLPNLETDSSTFEYEPEPNVPVMDVYESLVQFEDEAGVI